MSSRRRLGNAIGSIYLALYISFVLLLREWRYLHATVRVDISADSKHVYGKRNLDAKLLNGIYEPEWVSGRHQTAVEGGEVLVGS